MIELSKLYVVPTPIGNLKDITLRALEVLKEVDIIAAEDTRQTLKLLNHFNIKKQLIAYHMHNEKSKGQEILDLINNGKEIALVSDAGMPGISDPGAELIKLCIDSGIKIEVLPGATAFATALVLSGLDTTKFQFRGFISRDNKDRRALIEEVKERKETLIFYEAPHRILSTLSFLLEELGNRRVVLCRELTKLHEEVVRGTITEALDIFKEKAPKGEFVVLVEGKTKEEIEQEKKEKWDGLSIEEHIIKYINDGNSKKEAIKLVAKERKIPKSEVYKHSINV